MNRFQFRRGSGGSLAALVRSSCCLALGVVVPLLAAVDPSPAAAPDPAGDWGNRFICGAGRLMAVGDETGPTAGEVRIFGVDEPLIQVVHDGSRFVAISASHVLLSPDGISWTEVPGLTGLRSLAAGPNRLVAIARASDPEACWVLTSSDGATWSSTGVGRPLQRVRYANGVFVAMDDSGPVLSSVDGLTWTALALSDAKGGRPAE